MTEEWFKYNIKKYLPEIELYTFGNVFFGRFKGQSDVALMTQNAESIGREIALGIYKYLFQTEPSPQIQSIQINLNQTFPIMQQDNTRTGNNTMGGW